MGRIKSDRLIFVFPKIAPLQKVCFPNVSFSLPTVETFLTPNPSLSSRRKGEGPRGSKRCEASPFFPHAFHIPNTTPFPSSSFFWVCVLGVDRSSGVWFSNAPHSSSTPETPSDLLLFLPEKRLFLTIPIIIFSFFHTHESVPLFVASTFLDDLAVLFFFFFFFFFLLGKHND